MNEKELMKRKDSDWEITDLLWEIIRRWRQILIFVLVGAVMLSGYQLVKDLKIAKTTPQQVQVKEEKTLEAMENALGKQDMDEVLGAVAIKKQLDEKSTYSKESVLMSINPYEENVVYLQYYVIGDAAETDYASFFKQHISNGAAVSELVDVVTDGKNVYMVSDGDILNMNGDADGNKNSFVVRIRGLSEDDCKTMAEQVKVNLQQYEQKLNENISGVSLILIEENSAVVVDEELVLWQNQTATMIKQLNNNLDSLKSNMTGEQLALYVKYTNMLEKEAAGSVEDSENGAENENVSVEPQMTENKKSVQLSLTKLVLGAFLGLVLAVVWILLCFLFNPRLRSESEIKTLYHVNVIGTIKSGKKNRFDRQILKWRYHRAGALTLEQEVDLISANIKVACGNKDAQVYLTGSDLNKISSEFLEKIAKNCKEKGVAVVIGKEISYHADALEKMAEVGQVLFVEQIQNSYYDEIYQEITLCMEHKIPVMGMIVVGA